MTSVIHVQTYIRHRGQQDNDLSGFSAGPQRPNITYTYNIVSAVLLRTQYI